MDFSQFTDSSQHFDSLEPINTHGATCVTYREGRRQIMVKEPDLIGKEYFVPDGVLTICNGAFGFCSDYLVLSLPRSIKIIGDYIFGQEGGRIEIRR